MAKKGKKKGIAREVRAPISLGRISETKQKLKLSKTLAGFTKTGAEGLRKQGGKLFSMAQTVSEDAATKERIDRENLREERKEVRKEIGKRISSKTRQVLSTQLKSRRIQRRQPRPTLDLRRRPEREVPVKQHGFKEMEISNTNFLFK